MKNSLTLKVSLKYALIFGCITFLLEFIYTLTFVPEVVILTGGWRSSAFPHLPYLIEALRYILLITCLALAHYEYNIKNKHHISFGNAIIIGLLIIGISFILSFLYSKISYELVLIDKLNNAIEELGLEEKAGEEFIKGQFTTWKFLFSSLMTFLIQVVILFHLITLESLWKLYKKAGEKGWSAIVPIYNIIVLLRIVNKPSWWIVLFLIPLVNIVFVIWVTNLLAKKFGKNEIYTLGLIFLPFIFYPILGMSQKEISNE